MEFEDAFKADKRLSKAEQRDAILHQTKLKMILMKLHKIDSDNQRAHDEKMKGENK